MNAEYDGENALELCTGSCYGPGFQQIVKEATQYGAINGFTYLRYPMMMMMMISVTTHHMCVPG
jgi:hypothetical protein